MKIQYDAAVDAMYIQLTDKPFHKMKNINDDVNLDFDEQGNVIGIELLYVSHYADDVQQIVYQYSPKKEQPLKQDIASEKSETLAATIETATSEA
jgi:uncharacterized protein YuzE